MIEALVNIAANERLVTWVRRGTGPMAAIYPDDVDGTNPLRPLSSCNGLSPVVWVRRDTRERKAVYPDHCDGLSISSDPVAAGEYLVQWFHRGSGVLKARFPDDLTVDVGGDYEGPLDLVSGAVVAYGVRALSAAMLGQNIFRLRRNSDNAESNFAADAVTGDAPSAAITAWLSGANCFVVTWYDQSGNGDDITQSTLGLQPAFVASSQGGKPALGATDQDVLRKDDTINLANWNITSFSVAKGNYRAIHFSGVAAGFDFQIGDTAYVQSLSDGSNYIYFDYAAQINNTTVYLHEATIAETPTSSYLASGVALSGTNGSVGTVVAPEAAMDVVLWLQTGAGTATSQEVIVWNSILSAGNKTSIRENIATYYGITLS